jgi:hypothetical protein
MMGPLAPQEKAKEFKPCPTCPDANKCKAAGKCLAKAKKYG